LKLTNQGFTLIELLIAIVILAIISGIGVTNYLTSLKRGNDGKRAADLNNLRSALEMYYLDGKCTDGVKCYPREDAWKVVGTGADEALGELVSDYTRQLPSDPKSDRHYLYKSDGTCYCLSAKMEIDDNKRTSVGNYCTACPGPTAPENHSGICYLVTCP